MKKIRIILFFFLLLAMGCKHKSRFKSLTAYNSSIEMTVIQTGDSVAIKQPIEKVCFKVSHSKNIDLTRLHLVVNIDGQIVYSAPFQQTILCQFQKKSKLNTLAILLYDKTDLRVFSWSNKNVYNLVSRKGNCYKIILLSEAEMNYSNGIQMLVE